MRGFIYFGTVEFCKEEMINLKKEIAVFLNESGSTTSIFEAGVIKLYKKNIEKWEVIKEFIFSIEKKSGLRVVRKNLLELVESVNECKIFVGKEVTGVPYNILDVSGFCIFEIDGMPEEFLDYVIEQVENEEKARNDDERAKPYPVQTSIQGNYYINLIELQANYTDVTSKQALLPFLQKEKFYELEVVCSHIPPWFEKEFDKLNLKWETAKINETEYKVTVCLKTCNEFCGGCKK